MADDVSVVLIHGAWCDGSSWEGVIRGLQANGHTVHAVQLPLASLEEDTAIARRAIATIRGPVVVAAHGYGGAVMTGAATDRPNVISLIYVSAFAPDEGESVGSLMARFPAPAGQRAITLPDDLGFVRLDPGHFPALFAGDLEPADARVLAAVQKPLAARCLRDQCGPPAWSLRPSIYMLSEDDLMISPSLQRWMAARIQASVVSVPTSHASLIAHAGAVVELIEAGGRSSVLNLFSRND
jgi:pimeloyl-ACP methyl ester carboxylesterase